MKSKEVLADQNATQAEKGVVNIISPLITDSQATELMQPAERSFHDPAIAAQSTAMRRVPLGQDRLNAEMAQGLAMGSES